MAPLAKIILVLSYVAASVLPAQASGDGETGTIHLPDDLTLTLRRSITGTTPATLSPGRYDSECWIIRRRDADGVLWTCEGFIPNEKRVFDVVAGQEVQPMVGEPILSVLTAERSGRQVTFNHRLRGRLGERIRIERDGKRAPAPILRIANAEGSYQKALTFEYG